MSKNPIRKKYPIVLEKFTPTIEELFEGGYQVYQEGENSEKRDLGFFVACLKDPLEPKFRKKLNLPENTRGIVVLQLQKNGALELTPRLLEVIPPDERGNITRREIYLTLLYHASQSATERAKELGVSVDYELPQLDLSSVCVEGYEKYP